MYACTYIFLLQYSPLTTKPVCGTVCISCSCGRSGFADVKRHAFFRGIEWSSALAELIVPPMVPTVQSEGDSSNFDSYPDEQADEARGGKKIYYHIKIFYIKYKLKYKYRGIIHLEIRTCCSEIDLQIRVKAHVEIRILSYAVDVYILFVYCLLICKIE